MTLANFKEKTATSQAEKSKQVKLGLVDAPSNKELSHLQMDEHFKLSQLRFENSYEDLSEFFSENGELTGNPNY